MPGSIVYDGAGSRVTAAGCGGADFTASHVTGLPHDRSPYPKMITKMH
jgi:hypothetical protein